MDFHLVSEVEWDGVGWIDAQNDRVLGLTGREGAVTVICGLACFWLLPRDATSARYLDAEQKAALDHIHSLEPDSDAGAFSWRAVVDAMKSPQMWFTFIMFFGNGGGSTLCSATGAS